MTKPDHELEQRLGQLFATTPDPAGLGLLDARVADAAARAIRVTSRPVGRPRHAQVLVVAALILIASTAVGVWAIRHWTDPEPRDGDVGTVVSGSPSASLPSRLSGNPSPAVGVAVLGLVGTDWRLVGLGGTAVADSLGADIVFTEIRAGGSVGCDRFSAPYVSDLMSSVVFGPIASTMEQCGDAITSVAQAYLEALAKVAGYAIGADGLLTLSDANGATLLSFETTDPMSVVGHWIVTTISDGIGGVEAVPGTLGPTVTFDPDGRAEGFDGCADFSGGYSVHGGAIAIGPLMSMVRSCGGPKDDLARRYLTALQSPTTWSITRRTLALRDASGAIQVRATSGS